MKIISIIFLIVYSHLVHSQSWDWAKSSLSYASCDNYGKGIVSDKNGNTYITGRFSSPIMSFPGLPNLINASTSGCHNDFYIAKFDSLGNTIWAQRAGGGGSEGGNSIAMDTSGNIYVTGFCRGTLTFDTVTLTTASTGLNFFIVKYTPSGNALWAKTAIGNGDESGCSITTDNKNNVYVTGTFEDKIIFEADTISTNIVMTESVFIVKYDYSGNRLWVKGANLNGSTSITGRIRGEAICTDTSGSVYVAGNFNTQSFIFETDSLTKISADHDLFMIKLDSLGNLLWYRNYGANNDQYTNVSITTDLFGNVFFTGGYKNSMAMGSTILPLLSGANKIFIAKLNSLGTVLWARSAAKGTYPSYGTDIAPNQGRSIVADAIGNVWLTGALSDSATFGAISLYGSTGMFLVKYDSSGNAIFGTCVSGTNYNAGTSVSLDQNENVYVTGFFQSLNLSFGSYTISNYGFRNVFIAKLATGLLTDMEILSKNSSFTIYPNPFSTEAILAFEEEQQGTILKFTDILGKEVKTILFYGRELIIGKEDYKEGIYFIQSISTNGITSTKKILIQ